MKKLIITLLILQIGVPANINAQQPITIAQEQFIQNRARNKVKTYADHLELLTLEKSATMDEQEQMKQTIYLAFGKDGAQTRIYNDLIPEEILQSYSLQKSVRLDTYINEMKELYNNDISIKYSNFKVSPVYFSSSDHWYFVKVEADRRITGMFQHAALKKKVDISDKTDFYVYAIFSGTQLKMGGIYGVQPHTDKEYLKAKIIKGENFQEELVLISKPLVVKQKSIGKKLKRGKEYLIQWDGGFADDIIQLELVPDDTSKLNTKVYGAMLNGNSFSFTPSTKNKIGHYYFKIKNISTGQTISSDFFKIKRKIPLGIIISAVPILAATVIAIVVLTSPDVTDGAGGNNIADPPTP